MDFKQALVFAILMENGGGIIDKNPSYILEKLRTCNSENPVVLLDKKNKEKLNKWREKWNFPFNKLEK